jgi:UDPglucose 6-dehydrogenase
LANLADRLGADIEAVRRGIGSDPRIGFNFIYPGAGYGGSCFPKDVRALVHTAAANGYEADIVRSVELVNERQKQVLIDKVLHHFDGSIAGRTFARGLAPNPIPMTCAGARFMLMEGSGRVAQRCAPRSAARAQTVICEQSRLACDERDATRWRML